jgi:hypothetical protein
MRALNGFHLVTIVTDISGATGKDLAAGLNTTTTGTTTATAISTGTSATSITITMIAE